MSGDGLRELGSPEQVLLQGVSENVARALLSMRRIFETERRRRASGDSLDASQAASAIIRADENALLTSSWKAVRYLDGAIAEGFLPEDYAADFAPLRAPLKEVRDMREHDDEYRMGAGRTRSRYRHFDPASGTLTAADWTLIHQDRYLLGGRLPLFELMRALRLLFNRMRADGTWEVPWGDLGLAEHGELPPE